MTTPALALAPPFAGVPTPVPGAAIVPSAAIGQPFATLLHALAPGPIAAAAPLPGRVERVPFPHADAGVAGEAAPAPIGVRPGGRTTRGTGAKAETTPSRVPVTGLPDRTRSSGPDRTDSIGVTEGTMPASGATGEGSAGSGPLAAPAAPLDPAAPPGPDAKPDEVAPTGAARDQPSHETTPTSADTGPNRERHDALTPPAPPAQVDPMFGTVAPVLVPTHATPALPDSLVQAAVDAAPDGLATANEQGRPVATLPGSVQVSSPAITLPPTGHRDAEAGQPGAVPAAMARPAGIPASPPSADALPAAGPPLAGEAASAQIAEVRPGALPALTSTPVARAAGVPGTVIVSVPEPVPALVRAARVADGVDARPPAGPTGAPARVTEASAVKLPAPAKPEMGGAPVMPSSVPRAEAAAAPTPARPVPTAAHPAPVLSGAPAADAAGPVPGPAAPPAILAPQGVAMMPTLPAAHAPAPAATGIATDAPFAAARPAEQVRPALSAVAAGPPGAAVTLRLDPAELGAITVTLERGGGGGGPGIRIAVERPETLQLLRDDLAHLHAALDGAGMPSERTVSLHLQPPETMPATAQSAPAPSAGDLAAGADPRQNGAPPRHEPDPEGARPAGRHAGPATDVPGPRAPAPARARGRTGIDITA